MVRRGKVQLRDVNRLDKNVNNIFQAVGVKRVTLINPLLWDFYDLIQISIRQRCSQILDVLLHNVHSVLSV